MVRRILIVLTVVTALVSLSAVVMGSWRFEPFGIRLLSVSNPVKPLTFALVLALGPRADESRPATRIRGTARFSHSTRLRVSSCGCSASARRRR